MNGAHDVGGMHMGPIQREKNEPVFHSPWEARVYVMNRALSFWRKWSGHTSRYVKESMISPADYFRMSYYEKWYVGIVELLVNSKLVTRAEIESGKPAPGSSKATPPLSASQAVAAAMRGERTRLNVAVTPGFRVGQRVRSRNMHPIGHTRLPRYARGRFGAIQRDHGVFAFPDTSAEFLGDKPQHVYSVRFAARELWGDQAAPQDSVYLDLWEDYLEPA